MQLENHPNTREYLTRFLLSIRREAIVEETSCFQVEVDDGAEIPDAVLELLR